MLEWKLTVNSRISTQFYHNNCLIIKVHFMGIMCAKLIIFKLYRPLGTNKKTVQID